MDVKTDGYMIGNFIMNGLPNSVCSNVDVILNGILTIEMVYKPLIFMSHHHVMD